MRRRRLGGVVSLSMALAVLALLGTPGLARADFEQELVKRVMADRGLTPLPEGVEPTGRRIVRIEVAAVPVFTPADPLPDVLNVLHVTTREHVVRRELLFSTGDAYDPEKIKETARNLRSMVVLTTAAVVPFVVEAPDGVGVLIVTKDIWSLRHGFVDLFFDAGEFSDTLRVRGALTEMNLFGLNKSVALRYALNPWVRELGQSYLDRRALGSRWAFFESVDVLFDEETGTTTRGAYQLVRPFFSLDTRYAAQLTFNHDAGTSRAQQGKGISQVLLPSPADEEDLFVDHRYDRDSFSGAATFAWQTTGKLKNRLSATLSTSDRGLVPGPDVPVKRRGDFFDAIRRRPEFSNVLGLSWSLVPTDYHTLRNANVYGVTEDFLAGPQLSASVGLSSDALGSDKKFVRTSVSAGWRVVTPQQAVFSAFGRAGQRRQDKADIDRFVGLDLAIYSPAGSLGRLVWKASTTLRRRNRNLGFSALGGDGGLRGHPVGAVRGDSYWQTNMEWRTKALYWKTYQLGGAMYVDSGAAWFEGRPVPKALHGVGIGARYFLPQFNHRLVRLDLSAPPDAFDKFRFVFSFDQAF